MDDTKNEEVKSHEDKTVRNTQSEERIAPIDFFAKATDIGKAIGLDETQSSNPIGVLEHNIPLDDLAALPRSSINTVKNDLNGNYVHVLELCNAMGVSSSEFRHMIGDVNDTNAYIDVKTIKALPQMKLQFNLNSPEMNELPPLNQPSYENTGNNNAINNVNPYRDSYTSPSDSSNFFNETKSIVENSFIPAMRNETVSNHEIDTCNTTYIEKIDSSYKPGVYHSVSKAKMRACFFHYNEIILKAIMNAFQPGKRSVLLTISVVMM